MYWYFVTCRTKGKATQQPKQKKDSKRKKKGASSSTPQLDETLFLRTDNLQRYIELCGWTIIPEKRVNLKEGEYTEFTSMLMEKGWTTLATPPPVYDHELVLEFYANAYESDRPYASYMRGFEIDYSREAINAYLGHPFEKDDEPDVYHDRIRSCENPFLWRPPLRNFAFPSMG